MGNYGNQRMTDEEVDEGQRGAFILKTGLEHVHFDSITEKQLRYVVDGEGKGRWKKEEDVGEGEGRPMLILDLWFQIAETSPGENKKGRKFKDDRWPYTFMLTEDGQIDMEDEILRTKMNVGKLQRILFAFYGGKNKDNPGDYPKDADGFFHPVGIVVEEETFEPLRERIAEVAIGLEKDNRGDDKNVCKSWTSVK